MASSMAVAVVGSCPGQGTLNISNISEVLEIIEKYHYDCTSYYELGLHLGLSVNTLKVIEADYKGQGVSRCLVECLSAWLNRADNVPSPTWVRLREAFKRVGAIKVANGIESEKLPAACSIITQYYSSLLECICSPLNIARTLCKECVLTQESLRVVKSTRYPVSRVGALLPLIYQAISVNYEYLETFVRILRTYPSTIKVANAIWKEYEKCYADDDEVEEMPFDDDSLLQSSPGSVISTDNRILIPKSWDKNFQDMRADFGHMFSKIRQIITNYFKKRSTKDLISYLRDAFPELSSRLEGKSQYVNDILNIVRENCTLTNIIILEAIITEFGLRDAEKFISTYKQNVNVFCRKVSVRFCSGEIFEVVHGPTPLRCETITFVLDWEAHDCTIADVIDVIGESLGEDSNVKIRVIAETNSIEVICSFPVSLTGVLIARALDKLELLKKIGLLQLAIGYCTVYNDCKINEVEEIGQERVQEVELSSILDNSISNNEQYSTSLPIDPSSSTEPSTDVMIIGSYGTISPKDTNRDFTLSTKTVPSWLKGTRALWIKQEIEAIEKMYRKNSEKYRIQFVCKDLHGSEKSKNYYMERIKTLFVRPTHIDGQALIYYTGHGEKDTGNWCFKDGVITFQDILDLYTEHYQGKPLTIVSDCSYSGNWINECTKALAKLDIPPCGHYTRESGMLLDIYTSCQLNEKATALAFTNEAMYYSRMSSSVKYTHGHSLTSEQTPLNNDFGFFHCGQGENEPCKINNCIHLICGQDGGRPVWFYVLVEENKAFEFKTEVSIGTVNIGDYGKVLYSGWGEYPSINLV